MHRSFPRVGEGIRVFDLSRLIAYSLPARTRSPVYFAGWFSGFGVSNSIVLALGRNPWVFRPQDGVEGESEGRGWESGEGEG